MATATTTERRKLSVANVDDVVTDVRALHAKGYVKLGNWDLAQTCLHLTDWMRFPIDGFPKPPLPIRMMLWSMRVTVGKVFFRKVLADGMRPGQPTMPQTVYAARGDEAEAVAKLGETAERFKAYTGPIHPSPLFGAMDKETATRLQLIHCAHHLSFLVPKTDP
jgi:hypothetical protein